MEQTVNEKENLIKNLNCQIEDNKQIILSKNEQFAEMRSKYEVMSNQIQSIEREKGEFKEVDFIIEFWRKGKRIKGQALNCKIRNRSLKKGKVIIKECYIWNSNEMSRKCIFKNF